MKIGDFVKVLDHKRSLDFVGIVVQSQEGYTIKSKTGEIRFEQKEDAQKHFKTEDVIYTDKICVSTALSGLKDEHYFVNRKCITVLDKVDIITQQGLSQHKRTFPVKDVFKLIDIYIRNGVWYHLEA